MSTPINEIPVIVEKVRKTFNTGKTKSVEWRKQQIRQIIKLAEENVPEIKDALYKDLGHKGNEGDFFAIAVECGSSIADAKTVLSHLDEWVKPQYVETPLLLQPASSYTRADPLGLVLIVSPWNYPVSLLLQPLIATLAAGNCCVIKPSEVSPNVSKVMTKLILKYLDNSAVQVVEGAVEETTALLKLKWDHIFYTGNGTVGKIIMKAASEHLTPVTLELGGKSPCVVDDSVSVSTAAQRIIWGKFMNCGQTCIAPDYILVHKKVEKQLTEAFKTTLKQYFGENPQKTDDYSRIVNSRHAKRLGDLIEKSKTEGLEIFTGGNYDVNDRYVAPTIIRNVKKDSTIMADEIFGPILPVVAVDSMEEAVDIINEKEKPLALYVFSNSSRTKELIQQQTSSGGICINDVVVHISNPNLPFGGVGFSGIGAYHGKNGFEQLSHKKAVVVRRAFALDQDIRPPPYTNSKIFQVKLGRKVTVSTSTVVYGLGAVFIAGLSYFIANNPMGRENVLDPLRALLIAFLSAALKYLQ